MAKNKYEEEEGRRKRRGGNKEQKMKKQDEEDAPARLSVVSTIVAGLSLPICVAPHKYC